VLKVFVSLFQGEVNVTNEDLNEFLAVAEELQVTSAFGVQFFVNITNRNSMDFQENRRKF
jgi:hypothetical protein